MFGSMPASLLKAEYFVLGERIALQQARINNVSNALGEAVTKRTSVTAQLTAAQIHYEDLKALTLQKSEEDVKKFQEKMKIRSQSSALTLEYETALRKSQEAKSMHELKKMQSLNIAKKLDTIRSQTDGISQAIAKLDQIIISLGPPPQYHTSGGTCKNGHVNCPNLPLVNPGQTNLMNQAEISAHKAKVDHAREEKIRLLTQKSQLFQDESEARKRYTQLQLEVSVAQTDCWRFASLAQEKKQQIETNRQIQQQTEKAYLALVAEEESLQRQLAASKIAVNNLTQDVARAEHEVSDKQNQQGVMELELQRLNNQLEQKQLAVKQAEEQSRLEAIARRQLALEVLAMQELQQENEAIADRTATPRRLVTNGLDAVVNAAGKIIDDAKHMRDNVKKIGADVLQTAGDLWPSPIGTAVTVMFEGANGIQQGFFGASPQHTGNLLVDTVNSKQKLTK